MCTIKHFYPRSPCGERHRTVNIQRPTAKFLSTLSLRRATQAAQLVEADTGISIHALLAESDFLNRRFRAIQHPFLSTLSLRRATAPPYNLMIHQKNFYPRSPCGERRLRPPAPPRRKFYISIHALLAESDAETAKTSNAVTKFLSTLSLRRATFSLLCRILFRRYFYPRSPCGERPLR